MLTLQAILNTLNPLLEMLKLWGEANLMLIHEILKTLKPLLEMLKLKNEANLILIHAMLNGAEPCITDYNKLFHVSV